MRLIPRKEVQFLTGLPKSSLYYQIQRGNFPKPLKIGKTSRWIESEVNLWIMEQIKLNRSDAQIMGGK